MYHYPVFLLVVSSCAPQLHCKLLAGEDTDLFIAVSSALEHGGPPVRVSLYVLKHVDRQHYQNTLEFLFSSFTHSENHFIIIKTVRA